MRTKPLLLVLFLAWLAPALHADPLGTSFLYQGRLNDGGSPATGSYDLQFALDDANTNGNQVGVTLTNGAVTVSNGLFTVTLDFGSAPFDGSARWLEVGVRTNGSTDNFTVLSPRQAITAVPYALTALNFNGTVADSQLSANIARLSSNLLFTGTVQFSNATGIFAGDGTGLTGVPAQNLTGTLADARLSSNVALLNATQTFIGPLTIGSGQGTPDPQALKLDVGGLARAAAFQGDGSGLSGLNASSLTSGTVGDSLLSANVPRLNGNSTFTGAVQFNNAAGNFNGNFLGNGAGVTGVNLMSANSAGAIGWATNYPGNLTAGAPLTVGSNPFSIVAADVNGDGKVDLISGNYSQNTLTILTNDGKGGFSLASSPAVGNGPASLIAADLNGDGKVDLVCANGGDNTLTVLTNTGSGSFVLASTPDVESGPNAVTAADVNGDGKIDLISAINDDRLKVLTNDGSGGFVLASSPHLSGTLAIAVTAADVNGDGKVDLIGVNLIESSLSILTNDGSGGFVLASSPAVGTSPYSILAADINGDGKVDLITANNGANTVSVLTNDGSGGFVLASSPSVGTAPYSVAAADLNGDGKLDLVSANFGGNTLSVLINTGSGSFALASSPGVGRGPVALVATNLNADAAVDFVCANFTDNTLTLLLNTPVFQGSFTGNGAGLTGLNAASLAGTVPDARLSGTVALLNTSQTFSAQKTFNGTGVTLSLQNPITHRWDISVNADGNLLFTDATSGNFTFFRAIDGTVGSGSDLTLKKDITPLGQTLDRVLKLRPVSYRFKTSSDGVPRSLGFIAQEVEAIFPEVVAENGRYKGLSYSEMVPIAIGAIQDLNELVRQKDEELRALKEKADKVEGLERRLDALEQSLRQQTTGQNGGAR